MATADCCHLRLEQNVIFLRIFWATTEFENSTPVLRLRNTGNVMLETTSNTWFPGPTRDNQFN